MSTGAWKSPKGSSIPTYPGEARALLLLGATALLLGCAPNMPLPIDDLETRYESLLMTPSDEEGFESRSVISVDTLLPAALIRGDHHTLAEVALCDGFTLTYLVVSDFGELEVEGTGLLRKRVHEIEVVASLREHELKNSEVYALAAINAAEGPLEGAAQLLAHPVTTTIGIPKGMWSYARSIVEMTRGGRTYLEDDYGAELLGFAEAKREWAYRLGVDPYSTNPVLQRALNRYGWLSLAGGMTVRAPLMAVSGAASIALTVTSNADDMHRRLRDISPEDIRIDSRDKLRAMGVDAALVERFVHHPWYSPSRQLTIVTALESLELASDPGEFVEVAIAANEPGDTFFFARMALLLADFNEREDAIDQIVAPNGLVMAYTVKGGIVLPMVLDLGLWTKSMMRFADAIEDSLPELRPIESKRILASGFFSPRARREFGSRGWKLTEGLEMTWLAEHDQKSFEPGRPDPDRIIPEVGS